MALPVKPTSRPLWTYGNASPGAVRTEPTGGRKLSGWGPSERPSHQEFNWLLYNMGYEWLTYLEAATDQTLGLLGVTDAYVGLVGNPLATYTDINVALAAVNPGARIQILDSLAIATTVQVTKANVEIVMKPGVTLSKGGATTCLQISASGVRIKGGRIAGFNAGGDIGVLIDSGSNYSLIGEIRFSGNTQDISDLNNTGASYGLITE